MTGPLNVLIACEYSAVERDAFLAIGANAISCDLLPTDKPGPHYQGDVFDVLTNPSRFFGGPIHLMIAHPPCTYLCNSGFHNTYRTESAELCGHDRWKAMIEGAAFFRDLLQADVPRIAVENPVMVGYAKTIIGRSQSQTIQPWQYGHGEVKRTALWLKNLPDLQPTNVLPAAGPNGENWREAKVHNASPGPDRWKVREHVVRRHCRCDGRPVGTASDPQPRPRRAARAGVQLKQETNTCQGNQL